MFERSERDGVRVLALAHGKASALDLELLHGLARELDEERAHPEPLVLTGTGSIFCAGVDLVRIVDGGAAYVREFLPALDRAFRTLFLLEKPVVAAINGHAIAGGCVLACAADERLMAEGKGRVGVPELKVGVPFPPLALEIVRRVAPARHADDILLGGGLFTPPEALERGLVRELVPPAELVDRAVARISWERDAAEVANHVRGMDAVPGAWAELDGNPVKLFRPGAAEGAGAPGEVLTADPELGLIVACGTGALSFGEVQPPGRRRMPAGDWLRGRGVEAGRTFA